MKAKQFIAVNHDGHMIGDCILFCLADNHVRLVGLSTLCSYTSNVRGWISVVMIDDDVHYGQQIELVWGEPDGGSANPTVERHSQTTIRATVTRSPFIGDKQ